MLDRTQPFSLFTNELVEQELADFHAFQKNKYRACAGEKMNGDAHRVCQYLTEFMKKFGANACSLKISYELVEESRTAFFDTVKAMVAYGRHAIYPDEVLGNVLVSLTHYLNSHVQNEQDMQAATHVFLRLMSKTDKDVASDLVPRLAAVTGPQSPSYTAMCEVVQDWVGGEPVDHLKACVDLACRASDCNNKHMRDYALGLMVQENRIFNLRTYQMSEGIRLITRMLGEKTGQKIGRSFHRAGALLGVCQPPLPLIGDEEVVRVLQNLRAPLQKEDAEKNIPRRVARKLKSRAFHALGWGGR